MENTTAIGSKTDYIKKRTLYVPCHEKAFSSVGKKEPRSLRSLGLFWGVLRAKLIQLLVPGKTMGVRSDKRVYNLFMYTEKTSPPRLEHFRKLINYNAPHPPTHLPTVKVRPWKAGNYLEIGYLIRLRVVRMAFCIRDNHAIRWARPPRLRCHHDSGNIKLLLSYVF